MMPLDSLSSLLLAALGEICVFALKIYKVFEWAVCPKAGGRRIRLIGVAKCFHSWRTSTKRVNTLHTQHTHPSRAVIYESFFPLLNRKF